MHRNILPAGHVVATGGVGAGHDPGGPQGNGVHLVGRVGVPHDQLAVLAGGHEVPAVRGPVHGVYLGQVTSQRPPHPHLNTPNGLQLLHLVVQSGVAFLFSVLLQFQELIIKSCNIRVILIINYT